MGRRPYRGSAEMYWRSLSPLVPCLLRQLFSLASPLHVSRPPQLLSMVNSLPASVSRYAQLATAQLALPVDPTGGRSSDGVPVHTEAHLKKVRF